MILKSHQRFKNQANNIYTEEINKIALSSNDDKRLQTLDRWQHIHPDASPEKACKTKLLKYKKKLIWWLC